MLLLLFPNQYTKEREIIKWHILKHLHNFLIKYSNYIIQQFAKTIEDCYNHFQSIIQFVYNYYKNSAMTDQIESSQSELSNLPEHFQNANAIIQSIAPPKESQPTKNRVKNFKNRVFQLLRIYANKSHDVNPLISCLKQQMFFRQPERMNELINNILNKQNICLQNLQQLLQYYKIILLYKPKNDSNKTALDFIKILKKIALMNQEQAVAVVKDMLRVFAFERKCNLKVDFFFFFLRKYEHSSSASKIKLALIESCKEYLQDIKLRNAQKKQISKLLGKLDKTFIKKVKREEPIQIKENDDENENDIKVTNKTKKQAKLQKHEHGSHHQKNQQKHAEKPENGSKQQPKKKEYTPEQQQKLTRIKELKKKIKSKKNKQGKTQIPNKSSNNQHNNQQRPPNKHKQINKNKTKSDSNKASKQNKSPKQLAKK